MKRIDQPAATGYIRWIPHDKGGRLSGPPTAPVYATTASFVIADEEGIMGMGEVMSILIERTGEMSGKGEVVRVGFLAPEIAAPFLRPGVHVRILEGPNAVADLTISTVGEGTIGIR